MGERADGRASYLIPGNRKDVAAPRTQRRASRKRIGDRAPAINVDYTDHTRSCTGAAYLLPGNGLGKFGSGKLRSACIREMVHSPPANSWSAFVARQTKHETFFLARSAACSARKSTGMLDGVPHNGTLHLS